MGVTLRAAAAAAVWGLRAYRGTAALIALSGAAMLIAALPVAALMGAADFAAPTRLLLGPTRPVVAEAGWALSRSPAALRAEAVGVLFQALAGTGTAALVVGAIGVLLVFGAWGALGTIVRGLPAWEPAIVARYAALLLATTTIGALIPAWHAVRAAPAGLLASSGP